jgi:uncharacterized cupin superfamily protein
MSRIKVERHPREAKLKELGVSNWPIGTKEASEFPWTYDEPETCYFLEGEVTVTGDNGETARLGPRDPVTFPPGLSCTWKITTAVKKHYRFG